MGTEAVGKLHTIFEHKQVSERFAKREFVLELTDNPKYPQLVLFQLTGDRVAQLDDVKVGDSVRIEYSLRGREWKSPSGEVKYFNSLDVWKLERAEMGRGDDRGYNNDRGGNRQYANNGGGGGGGGYSGGGGGRGRAGGNAPPRRDDDAPPPAYEPRPSDFGGANDVDDLPF